MTFATPGLLAVVWGNMPPPQYLVRVPEGREPLYEWAGPAFLTFAIIAAGWWLIRVRNVRTGRARAWLWAAVGCLTIGFSGWWVWVNRDAAPTTGWLSSAAVYMPGLWMVGCAAVIIRWCRWVNDHENAKPGAPEVEPPLASDRFQGYTDDGPQG